MDKLANYGSDDDYEESPKHTKSADEIAIGGKASARQEADVNYEEVQMDMSEDANSNSSRGSEDDRSKTFRNSPRREYRSSRRNYDEDRYSRESKNDRRILSRDDRRERDDSRRERKNSKDRDRNRDRNRKNRHRDDRDRHRDERKARKSPNRGRSRSPKRDLRRRSGSRERGNKNYRRYERFQTKANILEKQELPQRQAVMQDDEKQKQDEDKGRFFMPGITGRFREQIERRKLLWQKKAEKKPDCAAPSTSSNSSCSSGTGKVWQATTFAQDSDGKVASKFKRLMGIKDTNDPAKQAAGDTLKRQEEMFSSMEQQYEVARTATHTMRGVGLGFGSFQR